MVVFDCDKSGKKENKQSVLILLFISSIISGLLLYGHYNRQRKIDDFIACVRINDMLAVEEWLKKEPWLVNARIKDNDQTPFHYANTNEMAELLITKGVDVNAKDKYGSTPLHCSATRFSRGQITELLIGKGANVNATTSNGVTPLHDAAYRKNIEAAEVLISHHADVNAKDNKGFTPLHYALKANYYDMHSKNLSDMANLLRQHGAKE